MNTRRRWRGRCALAAVIGASACDGFIRPPDPLEAHPDVVSVAILLVAGEREARLLAVHPHRPPGAAGPHVAARLAGPGWMASFSETLELEACTEDRFRLNPATCLGAQLPEPIQPRTRYGIEGTAPLGSFSGAMVVPAPPLLHVSTPDTMRLAPPQRSTVGIPIRYEAAGAGVGTVLAEALDVRVIEDDGTRTEHDQSYLGFFPQPLGGDGQDTVHVFYHDSQVRFSLQIVVLGRHYANFVAHTGSFPVPQPWPSFGIDGEGVYGYFDGAAASPAVQVHLTGAVGASGLEPDPRGPRN